MEHWKKKNIINIKKKNKSLNNQKWKKSIKKIGKCEKEGIKLKKLEELEIKYK